MILQSLTEQYYDLLERNEITKPGWMETKVGFALCLSEEGELQKVLPLAIEVQKKDKVVKENPRYVLPMPQKRGTNILPNFLWDNTTFIFGFDNKGKPDRSRDCFVASKKHHRKILGNLKSEAAQGIVKYFNKWDPDIACDNEILAEYKEELYKTNIVFMVNGVFAHEVPEIIDAWDDYYNSREGKRIQCSVTGNFDSLSVTHPFFNGVRGAKGTGATLVSFNSDSVCSYGKTQGENAPIGMKAAFAYTTAGAHMMSQQEDVQILGDSTIIYWAKGAEKQYTKLFTSIAFSGVAPDGMEDYREAAQKLANGESVPEYELDPEKEFFVVGFSPDVARISVRFFCQNRFGIFMKNVLTFFERAGMADENTELKPITIRNILWETINKNLNDKISTPDMTGSVIRAILEGTEYPACMFESVIRRSRTERNITRGQAGIIKAYFLGQRNSQIPKEILTVGLNENSKNTPYVLGRLFSIYEEVQLRAYPKRKTTIKSLYLNQAAAQPAYMMPLLNNMYQNDLRKLSSGSRIWYEKRVSELKGILGEELPISLSIPEQGTFQLGYYHQTQKRYEKNTKKGEQNDD